MFFKFLFLNIFKIVASVPPPINLTIFIISIVSLIKRKQYFVSSNLFNDVVQLEVENPPKHTLKKYNVCFIAKIFQFGGVGTVAETRFRISW